MSSDPASRPPAVVRPQPPRERRTRVWLGGLLLLCGGFFLGDTVHRLGTAWDMFATWWPWALIAVAVISLAKSFLRIESLIGPGLLVLVALVFLALRQGFQTALVLNYLVPLVAMVAGLTLLVSIGAAAGKSWTRVLVTGRVAALDYIATTLRPRAVLCELRADLSHCPGPASGLHDITMNVTVAFGHVHLTVPKDWNLRLESDATLLAPVWDPTDNVPEDDAPCSLRVHVFGVAGFVSIGRA